MMKALLGRKIGMTRVFDETGRQTAVTVLEAGPCVVVQKKTVETDGYPAIQVGFGARRESCLTKPARGHLLKAKAPACRWIRELPTEEGDAVEAGATITVDQVFAAGDWVDVCGTTKGKGFQGVIFRHGMSGGPMAHGSTSHRRVGSIGMREWPGRIFKNKRMPGHMGNVRVITQNLRIVQVRPEDHALLIEGAVPGPAGGLLMIRKAVKKKNSKAKA
ncbi:MAG: 50S ribosomal protein L3 [Kiritimatiellia bacterium]|nr:50S ribosomal protein L3 [Kiritimatiellia bacterium]